MASRGATFGWLSNISGGRRNSRLHALAAAPVLRWLDRAAFLCHGSGASALEFRPRPRASFSTTFAAPAGRLLDRLLVGRFRLSDNAGCRCNWPRPGTGAVGEGKQRRLRFCARLPRALRRIHCRGSCRPAAGRRRMARFGAAPYTTAGLCSPRLRGACLTRSKSSIHYCDSSLGAP